MAPGSTHSRSPREAAKGGLKGRTHEIQRLIGRSLRPTIDLKALGENTIHIDCEVLQADGGTRTASITGAWVALALACDKLMRDGRLSVSPLRCAVAAVSVGMVDGEVHVDLDYSEDSRAGVDANIVLVDSGDLVEVQATGEGDVLSRRDLDRMLDAAVAASTTLFKAQRDAVGSAAIARLFAPETA
jgi:ribonuclease PH